MVVKKRITKNKKIISKKKPGNIRRKTVRGRYAPEIYSGELASAMETIDINAQPQPTQLASQDIDVATSHGVGKIGNVGKYNSGGITFVDFSDNKRGFDALNFNPRDYEHVVETQPQYVFMQPNVPNIQIPFFDVGYDLPFDTPQTGIRNIIKRVRGSKKYKKDRRDFAYKHQLMVDSEVDERYWTKDGIYYIDVNIYDDIERRNALIALYTYRRNQSVNKASPALFKHKQSLQGKNKNIMSHFNPDALRRLTGDEPRVQVINTPRGMEAILSGEALRYVSDSDRGGVRLPVKTTRKKLVRDDDPLAWFINNARIVRTTPKKRVKRQRKKVIKSGKRK